MEKLRCQHYNNRIKNMSEYFYFNTMRKMVGGFGSMFSNIQIQYRDENKELKRNYRVPLDYASKHAFYHKYKQRQREDGSRSRTAVTFPRMAFKMGNYRYASDRAKPKNSVRQRVPTGTDITTVDKVLSQTQEIPYDYSFTLNIFTKNMEEGLQIVEQILPKFAPNRYMTIEEIPAINLCKDISVDLIDVTTNDENEGVMSDFDRHIEIEMQFIVRGYVYPPLQDSALINEIRVATKDIDSNDINSQLSIVSDSGSKDDNQEWKITVNQEIK